MAVILDHHPYITSRFTAIIPEGRAYVARAACSE
jgi:hypothetical protein